MKSLVAIVVGHTEKAQGATAWNGVTEYEFNTKLAYDLSNYLLPDFPNQVFFRDSLGINATYKEIEKYLPAYCIELHFNSVEDKSVSGIETLCSFTNEKFGKHIHGCLLRTLGSKDRGVKMPQIDERGYRAVTALDCPMVLLEPFFGSNQKDYENFVLRKKSFLRAIVEAIRMWEEGSRIPYPIHRS